MQTPHREAPSGSGVKLWTFWLPTHLPSARAFNEKQTNKTNKEFDLIKLSKFKSSGPPMI